MQLIDGKTPEGQGVRDAPCASPRGFAIRGLEIAPPLVLAPMAGLTHAALRRLILDFGGVGLLFTEMLAAGRVPHENPELSPYLIRTPGERPLAYQLLLAREEEVDAAVTALHRLGADVVDLNLGCPAPTVRKKGGGAALRSAPHRVERIVTAVRRATWLPLSAKIRLGERLDPGELKDFCQLLEGCGIDMLTVHARLSREKFCRPPRWEWVARVKEWVKIPVVANGGIGSVRDARRCLELSGADGLMIGRAAPRVPWIFAAIAREVYGLDLVFPPWTLEEVYCRFVHDLESLFPETRRLGRLKEFTHYFAANFTFGHHLASAVQASRTMAEAGERAREFFSRNRMEADQPAGERPSEAG